MNKFIALVCAAHKKELMTIRRGLADIVAKELLQ